jgi:hypothetical protein
MRASRRSEQTRNRIGRSSHLERPVSSDAVFHRHRNSILAWSSIALLALPSCGIWLYHDLAKNLSNDQVAVLDWRRAGFYALSNMSHLGPFVAINDEIVDYARKARLIPGPHTVELFLVFSERRQMRRFKVLYRVLFEAGRVYRVGCSYGAWRWSRPRDCWVEDVATGERVGELLHRSTEIQ